MWFGVFVSAEASPRAVTSPGWEWQTRIFPGTPRTGLPPCLLFLSLVCLVGAVRLPSLVLVRVIQEGPAPLDDRDVPLRFTTFQFTHYDRDWKSVMGTRTPE